MDTNLSWTCLLYGHRKDNSENKRTDICYSTCTIMPEKIQNHIKEKVKNVQIQKYGELMKTNVTTDVQCRSAIHIKISKPRCS